DTYSTLIETRRDLVERKPDLVRRFVEASILGWYRFLYGDNASARALIRKDNPEMTDDLIAYSVDKMKVHGIVDSGDTLKFGIGARTDARVKGCFAKMLRAAVGRQQVDLRKAYMLQFVDKGVGRDQRPKN